jgi:hypothetical protein
MKAAIIFAAASMQRIDQMSRWETQRAIHMVVTYDFPRIHPTFVKRID